MVAVLLSLALLSGCSHHERARIKPPPTPEIVAEEPAETTPEPSRQAVEPPSRTHDKVLYSETGLASWYGPPYHNRRASNGEIYNMNALTAAHRTLPLGTKVRVTNMKTQSSVVVRITDRGPFIEGRIIDLSMAAAKEVDVWRPGTAPVRIDVLETPAPIETGGRWAVQIGAFEEEDAATKLSEHLAHRYHSARVQQFSSPVGDWWVRVRVPQDDKREAEEIAHATHTPEGSIFLVRLD